MLQQGEIFADQYQLKKLVDTGGFAEVWEALFLKVKPGNTVALKIFPRLNDAGIKNIENEYLTQVDLMHSNLITARHFGIHEGRPYLVMRFCNGGNAIDKAGEFNETEVAKCLHQVASALTYLHNKDILHKDIKPNNILLDDEGNFYLTDMGLSMKLRQTIQRYTQVKSNTDLPGAKNDMNTTGLTPPPYRALELWDHKSVGSTATDVWALGASIFEIAANELPFLDYGGSWQKDNPEPPDLPLALSGDLNKIIKKCLSKDKEDRPTAEEIVGWTGNYLKNGDYKLTGEPLQPIQIPTSTPILQVPTPTQFAGTIMSNDLKTVNPTMLAESTTKKGKGVGGKKIIIGIVLLLVVLVAVFFVFNKWSPKKSETVVRDTTKQKVRDSSKILKPNPVAKTNTAKKSSPPIISDADKDGVPDSLDRCPGEAGPASNLGCPEHHKAPDRDHDGVPDAKDDCPDLPGKANNHGCPQRPGS